MQAKLHRSSVFLRVLALEIALSLLLFFLIPPRLAHASYVNTNLNTFVHDANEVQVGYPGQDMNLRFRVGYNNTSGMKNPKTAAIQNVIVRLSNDQNYLKQDKDPDQNTTDQKNPYDKEDESDLYNAWRAGQKSGIDKAYGGNSAFTVDGGNYPFEINATTFTEENRFASLKAGEYKTVTLHVTVRADAKEGYYGVPVAFYYALPGSNTADFRGPMQVEFINVYIKAAGEVANPSTATGDKTFVLGEGQETPVGTAPGIINYSLKFRNQRKVPVYRVQVHMNTALADGASLQATAQNKSQASTGFPFNLNDANYDRNFESAQPDEVLNADYSMAIMQNAANGYYPLSYTVSYKLTPDATVSYQETYVSYVRINNPSMVEQPPAADNKQGDFNPNDRQKARIILDGYRTEPEKVFAGQPFTLVLSVKNASGDIPASNILLSAESEKVDNSSVFSTEAGSNSFVINSLKAGEAKELRLNLEASAGVDPRSYTITLNEKFDSPAFKNAEDKLTLDIPVFQVARYSISTPELSPDSIEIGKESNVMFNLNNTGRVMLYNVQVNFEGDAIKKTSAYLGNIKSGDSGSVDAMLSGAAASSEENNIKMTIQYEDVNGNVTKEEKTLTLTVTEPAPDMPETDADSEKKPEKKRSPIPLFGIPIGIATAALGIYKMRKDKRKGGDAE